jgi:hypothetical protein
MRLRIRGTCTVSLYGNAPYQRMQHDSTADLRRHETPNLDWNAEFRNAEFRFSQLLYHGQTLVLHKLTESKFGIPKFGIPIEIWSLMSPGIGCIYRLMPLRLTS